MTFKTQTRYPNETISASFTPANTSAFIAYTVTEGESLGFNFTNAATTNCSVLVNYYFTDSTSCIAYPVFSTTVVASTYKVVWLPSSTNPPYSKADIILACSTGTYQLDITKVWRG
jgi:hypothetical protein